MKSVIVPTLLCTVILMACSNPDAKEHEYVDLGLSVKWATVNIGASSPEDCGDYFAWGEVEYKGSYSVDNYKWNEKGSYMAMKKYNGMGDNKYVLDSTDDAAHENWGGSWRMPTSEEIKELVDCCTWEKTTINSRRGYRVTGPSGNSIFLPAAGSPEGCFFLGGYYENILLDDCSWYWSNSLCMDDDTWGAAQAYTLYFSCDEDEDEEEVLLSSHFRNAGFSIRPVCP